MIKRKLYGPLEISASLTLKRYYEHSKIKSVSPHSHVIGTLSNEDGNANDDGSEKSLF